MARKGETAENSVDGGFTLKWRVIDKDEIGVYVSKDGKEVSDLGYPNLRGKTLEYLADIFKSEAVMIAQQALAK